MELPRVATSGSTTHDGAARSAPRAALLDTLDAVLAVPHGISVVALTAGFWRSPLRGPWFTAVLGAALLPVSR